MSVAWNNKAQKQTTYISRWNNRSRFRNLNLSSSSSIVVLGNNVLFNPLLHLFADDDGGTPPLVIHRREWCCFGKINASHNNDNDEDDDVIITTVSNNDRLIIENDLLFNVVDRFVVIVFLCVLGCFVGLIASLFFSPFQCLGWQSVLYGSSTRSSLILLLSWVCCSFYYYTVNQKWCRKILWRKRRAFRNQCRRRCVGVCVPLFCLFWWSMTPAFGWCLQSLTTS